MQTPEQVKKRLQEQGKSIADWARANGFRPGQVVRVLNGYEKGIRGDAYLIATKLGLKDPATATQPE